MCMCGCVCMAGRYGDERVHLGVTCEGVSMYV